MKLTAESDVRSHYLLETEEVDYSHPLIMEKAEDLYLQSANEVDFVRRTYSFVRDHISHSWDIQSSRVTCKASEALLYKEGICYAKSNLLSALLRYKGIPTGFCYQRLTLGDTPDTGYCIHALNAVYIQAMDRWVRLDARGNKAGVDAQFSMDSKKLAFPVREYYEEIDYPVIYVNPCPETIAVLKEQTDCLNMCLNHLPTHLKGAATFEAQ
ncbi:transglutaminase family protein [Paenibacillus sp. SYP-B3998]|uniref:Transglutaminase family protein n=1 Tax=Paenibacillus sp. SYP-B3998 TaxID=2678564 RepID=A0A6G3ZTN0_9BACL|nr:transglutaminase family protein [Paenibacillus sp. SYP-B3998]NEW04949.1 transglutaminase family protein [Paenibacillus sp. SYP-B3998]